MSLRADVALTAGTLRLDVELEASSGEVVVVLGPNGAGKTTLLRALAGLAALERGRVEVAGRVLEDTAAGVYVPPEERSIGFVFQDYALFPHLDAIGNVSFGLRARGVSRKDARDRAAKWLDRVGLSGMHTARARALSGGQAQRVALARALVIEPQLLLLDEPLAALDATVRLEMRRDLLAHIRDFDGVVLLVTHDPVEAMAFADRLVVIEDGRVVQSGDPASLTSQPRSRYVADLVGVNLYRGEARGTEFSIDTGGALAIADPLEGRALATVHPRAVAIHRQRPKGSPRNVWAGTVRGVDLEHDRVRVRVNAMPPIVAEVTAASARELRLAEGGDVWVSVKATEVAAYPE